MDEQLRESLEDVVELIPRFSWSLMDEVQKDELMAGIVLPRYKAITSDGTKLGPTTWAAILGTTPASIKDRVARLNAAKRRADEKGAPAPVLTESDKSGFRSTKSTLVHHPEAAAAFVESLPDEAKVAVAKAIAQTPASMPVSQTKVKQSKAAIAPLKRTMNDVVAKLETVNLIDQATASINRAVSNDGLTPEAVRQIEEAVERLTAALDFAKSMAGEVTG